MARMPEAQWLGEHSPKNLMQRYDVVCIHTIVGYAPAHAAHFSVHQGGTIQQSRDTKYRSAANLYGNHRVIAIENEDHGSAFPDWNTSDGHAVPPLTDAQITANAKILVWAHKTHGVPLQLCPDSRSESRGLGYHRQGIDGNFSGYDYGGRVNGGELWSKHYGKVCPGDERIDQRHEILRRAKAMILGGTVSLENLTSKEKDELYEAVARNDDYAKAPVDPNDDNPHWWLENIWEYTARRVRDVFDIIWRSRYGWVPGWMRERWPESFGAEGKYPKGYLMGSYQIHIYGRTRQTIEVLAEEFAKVNGKLDGLSDAIQQLAENSGQPIDLEQVRVAAEQGTTDALAELNLTLSLTSSEDEA